MYIHICIYIYTYDVITHLSPPPPLPATWVLNVWVEDGKRRRWRLQRIFQCEHKRLSTLLSDLLPTFDVDDVDLVKGEGGEEVGGDGEEDPMATQVGRIFSKRLQVTILKSQPYYIHHVN